MRVIHDQSFLTSDDLHLFNEGSHFRLYDKLGAHPVSVDGVQGTNFAVWAPNAERIDVIGDFNGWQPGTTDLHQRHQSGIWEGFLPGVKSGDCYKYRIVSRHGNYTSRKPIRSRSPRSSPEYRLKGLGFELRLAGSGVDANRGGNTMPRTARLQFTRCIPVLGGESRRKGTAR